MEQSVLELLPFLKEMEKLLERVLPENIELRFSHQPGNYVIKADPTRIQQVLMNLALNARDAMLSGGVLEFELARYNLPPGEASPLLDLPAGEWVRLSVQDSGEGIPPEALSRIFDPFFTTKPVGEGTGLGLAQAYGIIKQHGGSIDVRSQPGQGTTFIIYLPALPSVAEPNPEARPEIQIDASGGAILLVEDDPAAQKAIRLLLESREFQVFTAHNGIEALEIFARETKAIRLVISDVVMPEMGGVALYKKLKEIHPRLKFLFITGHPLEAKSQVLLEEEQVHWLQKPFSAQTLIVTLNEMLHDQR